LGSEADGDAGNASARQQRLDVELELFKSKDDRQHPDQGEEDSPDQGNYRRSLFLYFDLIAAAALTNEIGCVT
jgi:hypothetical protein